MHVVTLSSATALAYAREWAPGSYRGLTVGTATMGDVERVLGKPDWVGHPEDPNDAPVDSVIAYEYKNPNDSLSRIRVWMPKATDIVDTIILEPRTLRSMPVGQMEAEYGRNYVVTSFDSGPCDWRRVIGKRPSSGQAELTYRVYPELGMIVLVTEDGYVQYISFENKCP